MTGFSRHLIAAAWLCAAPAAHAATVFDFEDVAVGTAVPFTIAQGGLTAAFATMGDSAYAVTSAPLWSNLSGAFVGLPPFATFLDRVGLTIDFSTAISALSLQFGLDGGAGETLTLTTDSGLSATVGGVVPMGGFLAQNAISVTGAAFSHVTITASTLDFAIDTLSVEPSATVPAPGALAALLGLGALAAARRRT